MKTGWRQLLIVAVVAAVFGGGAGYLGANFETEWVIGPAAAEELYTDYMSLDEERKRQLKCIERLLGIYGSPSHDNLYYGCRIRTSEQKQQEINRRLECLEAKVRGEYISPGMMC